MEDLTYQALSEIRIDPVEATVDVTYSEPDQGGSVLRQRYKIPPDRRLMIVLQFGRSVGDELEHTLHVSWQELSSRIRRDLAPWLAAQRQLAQSAGKVALDEFLGEIERTLAV